MVGAIIDTFHWRKMSIRWSIACSKIIRNCFYDEISAIDIISLNTTNAVCTLNLVVDPSPGHLPCEQNMAVVISHLLCAGSLTSN